MGCGSSSSSTVHVIQDGEHSSDRDQRERDRDKLKKKQPDSASNGATSSSRGGKLLVKEKVDQSADKLKTNEITGNGKSSPSKDKKGEKEKERMLSTSSSSDAGESAQNIKVNPPDDAQLLQAQMASLQALRQQEKRTTTNNPYAVNSSPSSTDASHHQSHANSLHANSNPLVIHGGSISSGVGTAVVTHAKSSIAVPSSLTKPGDDSARSNVDSSHSDASTSSDGSSGSDKTFMRLPPSALPNHLLIPRSSSLANILTYFDPECMHILVVDDDVQCQETMAEWLAEAKYHVTLCNDGEEAMEVLNEAARTNVNSEVGLGAGSGLLASSNHGSMNSNDHSASTGSTSSGQEDIDLVISDVMMQTPSSQPLLDYITTRPAVSHIPVILMSVDWSAQVADRTIRRGAEDFLRKPLTKSVLLKTVRTILEKRVERRNAEMLKQMGDKYKQELIDEKNAQKQQKKVPSLLSAPTSHDAMLRSISSNGMSELMNNIPVSPMIGSSRAIEGSTNSVTTAGIEDTLDDYDDIWLIDHDAEQRAKIQEWMESQLYHVTCYSAISEAITTLTHALESKRRRRSIAHVNIPFSRPSRSKIDNLSAITHGYTNMNSLGPLPEHANANGNSSGNGMLNTVDLSTRNLTESARVPKKNSRLTENSNGQTSASLRNSNHGADMIICHAEFPDNTSNAAVDKLMEVTAMNAIPVILIHSKLSRQMSDSIRKGAETVVTKPISKDVLLKKVSIILETIAHKRKTELLAERASRYRLLLSTFRKNRDDDIKAGKRSPLQSVKSRRQSTVTVTINGAYNNTPQTNANTSPATVSITSTHSNPPPLAGLTPKNLVDSHDRERDKDSAALEEKTILVLPLKTHVEMHEDGKGTPITRTTSPRR